MSQINIKSISGITSITTPAGVDNQLTVHTNDTTEKLKVTSDGVNVTGVVTATSFVGALPITGDTNNRVITATGSGELNGEANLTFNSSVLGLHQSSVDTNFVLDAVGSGIFTKDGTFTSNDFNKGQFTVRNTTASQGAFLDFRAASSSGARGVIAKIGGFNTKTGSGYDGELTFSTRQNSDNTMVERLRITSDGKVGINTTNPQALLEIQDRSVGTLIGLSVGTQYGNASFGGYNNYPAIMNNIGVPLLYCDTNNDRTILFGDTVGFGTTCSIRIGNAGIATVTAQGLSVTGNLTQSSTGALQIAKGTTAQRPSGVAGQIRYNTTANKLEYYDGSAWQSVKTTFEGSGGNSTYTFGGYKVHVFTSDGNFTVTGAGTVDALIVAGGGGAGASDRNQYNGAWSGGGGGGGVLWQQSISVASGTTYSIVIGDGGAVQNNGQNSTAFGYTAIGGGRGGGTTSAGSGNVNWNGASGGSGGGGLGDRVGPMQGGSGTSGQGNNGANGTDPGGNPYYEQGGGGGGAGEAGDTDGYGFGGDGRDMSGEFGTSVGENGYFGGGGAGGQGTDNSASVNSGGLGGGGDSGGGYQNNSYASQAGQANTGGGGGAGGNTSGGGAGGQAGGSGIVLVRYAL